MAWENVDIVIDGTTYSGKMQTVDSNSEFQIPSSAGSYTSFEVSGQSYEVNTKSDSNSDNDMIHVNALN